MKLHASAQNSFAFDTALPLVGHWENGSAKRPRYAVRRFTSDVAPQTAVQRDELARKQEMVCAVILSLCLLFTFAVCFSQLARF